MINIINKTDCCGCTACKSICPKHCIHMECDEEGFAYPIVDKTNCIECDLCEKVCPVIHPLAEKSAPLQCFASRSKQSELVQKSSSGGLFSVFAENILKEGGVVVGAAFRKDWSVHHIIIDNLDSLSKLRESKYVQSDLEDVFRQIKQHLKIGKKVLFIGTPCQVAGINHYIGHNDNLLTIDLICHSVPSPIVWRDYLKYITKKHGGVGKISKLTFRDKTLGWRKFSLLINVRNELDIERMLLHEGSNTNLYMQGFLHDLFNRPSCTKCPARNYKSGSDITLGDCWAVEKYYPQYKNDEVGLSVVLLNSQKGTNAFNRIAHELDSFHMQYEEVEPKAMHAPLTKSTGPHPCRSLFFYLKDIVPFNSLVRICLIPIKILNNIISFVKKCSLKILGESRYEYIKRKIRKQ